MPSGAYRYALVQPAFTVMVVTAVKLSAIEIPDQMDPDEDAALPLACGETCTAKRKISYETCANACKV